MRPHPGPLVLGERALLPEHAVGQRHAAHVVEDPREPHALHGLGREAELARGQLGQAAHALAMRRAAEVAHVERLGEIEERRQLHVRVGRAPARRAREDAGHLRARDHRPVAAEALRGVQGLVGGAEEPVGRLAVQRERRDAEADRERAVLALRRERLVHGRPHPLGEHVRAVLVAVRREHRELLTSNARGAVEAALGVVDRVCHTSQHRVAGRVAEGVVHPLEAVEVAHDQAERLVAAPRALELGVEDVLEAAPVEQLGERVAVGGVAEAVDHLAEPVADQGHEEACAEQTRRRSRSSPSSGFSAGSSSASASA